MPKCSEKPQKNRERVRRADQPAYATAWSLFQKVSLQKFFTSSTLRDSETRTSLFARIVETIMSPFAPRKVVFSSRLWLEPTSFRVEQRNNKVPQFRRPNAENPLLSRAKGDVIVSPFPAKGDIVLFPILRVAELRRTTRPFLHKEYAPTTSSCFIPFHGLARPRRRKPKGNQQQRGVRLIVSRRS